MAPLSDAEDPSGSKDQSKVDDSVKTSSEEARSITFPPSPHFSHTASRVKKSVPPMSGRRIRMTAGALLIIISVSAGFLGGWLGGRQQDNSQTTIQKQQVVLENQGQLISSIANNVGQSVVSITSDQTSGSNSVDSLFGMSQTSQQSESAGTGIILTSSEQVHYYHFNRHVVPAGSTNVSVTLSDGTTFNNVQVVGRTSTSNRNLDIAFLQIQNTNGHKLTPAQIGSSSKMVVGDSVVAIGNALGQYQNTVTTGIISGYGRSIQASDSTGTSTENLTDMFQTDAAINEGNSGGPLVNMNGEVIGINTAVASSAQNIGFAIPIDNVTGLIKSVEQTGKLQQPYLGVYFVPITSDVAKQYDLSVSTGAYIPTSSQAGTQTVISGGPAANAGVQEGDIITKVNDTPIDQQHSLTSVLDQQTPGTHVTLTIIRSGKQITADVTLGTAPTD